MVELFCPTRHTDSNNEKGCRIVSDKVVLKTVTKQTLQSKLIVLLVLFAFLSAALVGGVSTYMNVTQKKDNIAESNRELTGQAASEIERFMSDAKGLTEALAATPTARSMDAAQIKEMIVAAQQKNPYMELIYVMDASGMQIARTSGSLANRADRPYFKDAMAGKLHFSDAYISSFTKAPTVTISTAIRDAAGKPIGVFAADISLKSLWSMAEAVKVGQGGYLDIVDNRGKLLAHPDKDKVQQNESVADRSYIAAVLQGQSGSQESASTRGEQAMISYSPAKSIGWGVVAYLPSSEVSSQIWTIVLTMAGLLLLVAVCAGATAVYSAKGLAQPLLVLDEAAERMADGDLSRSFEVDGVEEIMHLGDSITRMQQNLHGMIKQVASSSEHLAASSEELTASADQSAQASQQVAQSITDVAHGTDDQLKAVQQAAHGVEAMSSRIQEVAANLGQMAHSSTETAQAARGGEKAVQTAVKQMQLIESSVSQSAEVVARLGERSQEIGQIVDTISGIAGQTNLLALNAAIEAARAGEQGRGFAVVADEVRKLAEQSQEAAKRIAELISEIQGDTQSAVVAMQDGTREVERGTAVVDDAGHTFTQIVGLIDSMYQQVQHVSQAAQEIGAHSQDVVQSVQRIESISRETAGHTQTVSAATEEQSASMEEIATSSQALAKMAEEMQQTVGRFRL